MDVYFRYTFGDIRKYIVQVAIRKGDTSLFTWIVFVSGGMSASKPRNKKIMALATIFALI